MKKLFYPFLSLFFLAACSESNDIPVPENPDPENVPFVLQDKDKFYLQIEDSEVNILNPTTLRIIDPIGVLISIPQLIDYGYVYDSIIWKIKGVDAHFKAFEVRKAGSSTSANLSHQWTHTFFYPGKYEMYLLGYRGEEVIHADTTTVNVVNDRDILGRNWTDERQLGHNVGYNDVLGVNDDFTTYAVDYAGVPTVNFYFRVSVDMEPDAMNKLKYSRLNGYINSLYGKPIYSRDDEKLNEVYQSFAYQPDHTMPLTYWETEKSKIVLLYFEDKEEDYTNIYMHAEPINQ